MKIPIYAYISLDHANLVKGLNIWTVYNQLADPKGAITNVQQDN
jgi:hypothetical protein